MKKLNKMGLAALLLAASLGSYSIGMESVRAADESLDVSAAFSDSAEGFTGDAEPGNLAVTEENNSAVNAGESVTTSEDVESFPDEIGESGNGNGTFAETETTIPGEKNADSETPAVSGEENTDSENPAISGEDISDQETPATSGEEINSPADPTTSGEEINNPADSEDPTTSGEEITTPETPAVPETDSADKNDINTEIVVPEEKEKLLASEENDAEELNTDTENAGEADVLVDDKDQVQDILEDGEGISCGVVENTVFWKLDENGTLKISGQGEMQNWESEKEVPWDAQRQEIKKIQIADGVTSVGAYAFSNCTNVTETVIPDSVQEIGEYAFFNCSGLSSVTIG